MIELVKREIDEISLQNRDLVKSEFTKMQGAYDKALHTEDPNELIDTTVYTSESMN